MKTYTIKEVFWTLQGEGSRAGTAAVFVRFAGCNLWNGKPADRAKGAGECARWCDTDFTGGATWTAAAIINGIEAAWGSKAAEQRWCVLTGGEPLLQVDSSLLRALQAAGWRVAIETNGTQELAPEAWRWIDHVTCSPKIIAQSSKYPLLLRNCTDLKVVVPGTPVGAGWDEAALLDVGSRIKHQYAFVQPCDPVIPESIGLTLLTYGQRPHGPARAGGDGKTVAAWQAEAHERYTATLRRCVEFVKRNPHWRLGTQAHKQWELP